MLRVIHKFPVDFGNTTRLSISKDFKIVLAGLDSHGENCLWIDYVPGAPKVEKTFLIIGTGQTYNENYRWVASFKSGIYIWHVMEARNPVIVASVE